MNPVEDLTIVTTATAGYVKYLEAWAASIRDQALRPAALVLVGNGLGGRDRLLVRATIARAEVPGCFVDQSLTGLGAARNVAVCYAATPWVMHLDADDTLDPGALERAADLGTDADVIQFGYRQWWPNNPMGYPRSVVYQAADGLAVLELDRIASGCSPFRRALWEQWPYPEYLEASWDYGLWLGFAHLGARFRPTPTPVFSYRQHVTSHWRRVGQHRHHHLLALRRRLEQYGVARTRTQLETFYCTENPQASAPQSVAGDTGAGSA